MILSQRPSKTGQGLIEYALILVAVAIVVMVFLTSYGTSINDLFRVLPFFQDDESDSVLAIKDDFLDRIQEFYEENSRWPRSWGEYAYTDIGLDPDDWDEPVEGIYWGPHGADVGLANRHGDNLEIYVDDLNGNRLHLYNGWNIWCRADDGKCYYHRVAPQNEIDITTLEVVEE